MDENLYEILNVDIFSTNEEIKRQYKQLALKYHPDKFDGDEAMFKKISNAYKILSDDENKLVYDYELKKLKQNDTSYIFEDVLKSKNEIIRIPISIDLNDILHGCCKTYEYIEKQICVNCDGTGIENPKTNTIKCLVCDGTGKHKEMSFLSCMECNGKGIFIIHKNICKKCLGQKIFLNKKQNTITLKPNIDDNKIIKISKQLEICVKYNLNIEEDYYTIKYQNNIIFVKINVSIIDIICGFQKQIKICDKTFIIESHEIFDINKIIRKKYLDHISIIFRFILQKDDNDTKYITRKLSSSFRNVLRIKPFKHFSPDFKVINVQD